MLIRIFPENPNPKDIQYVADEMRKGAIVIYPTDTVYGIGCSITNAKAVEKVARIKNINLKKDHLSFICYDMSHISEYAKILGNDLFRLLKNNLPGAFTFILNANSNVPKLFKSNKKTVGVRVPDNAIIRALVKELGHPILSTSVIDDDDVVEYTTDPELIYEKYQKQVDIVINAGYGDNTASTIVDCTKDEIEIIRQGKGELK